MSAGLEALLQAGYRYALSLSGTPADAQDLVQESWARLLARHGQHIERALLFRAIRNLYIDGHRHRRRFPTDSIDEHGGALNEGVHAIEEPTDAPLQRALQRLPDSERETLFLAVIEGWTAAEIASATGRPRGSVLSTLHRCRRKLRGWLADEGHECTDTAPDTGSEAGLPDPVPERSDDVAGKAGTTGAPLRLVGGTRGARQGGARHE